MNKRMLVLFMSLFIGLAVLQSEAQESLSFEVPEYTVETLDNGLTVYLMERRAVPLIYVNMVFDAGAINDGDSYGLANLTADALMFGAGERSKAEIEELVDFYGASLGSGGGSESAEVNASFATEDAEVFFPLLKDVVLAPRFDEEEFAKHVSLLKMRLERAKESPNAVIGTYYNKFIYGDHPYGNPVSGTIPSVSEITLESVKQFYNSYYRPETAAIILVGDFETAAMLETVKQYFGEWEVSTPEPARADVSFDSAPYEKSRVLIIDKPDSVQTTFVIGCKGVAMSHADFVGINLVNTILGGRFTSWLNTELRIKSGLSYGARSNWDMRKEGGVFAASSFTATPTTGKALELAVATLKRLHETGIDAETLQSGKNYTKGNFPRSYESPGQLANLLTSMHVYGLDDSFINDFYAKLDAVTAEKVESIIAEHYPAESFQIVLAGKAEAIKDIAAEFGDVTVVSIYDDEYLSK
jgi:zinc protease